MWVFAVAEEYQFVVCDEGVELCLRVAFCRERGDGACRQAEGHHFFSRRFIEVFEWVNNCLYTNKLHP